MVEGNIASGKSTLLNKLSHTNSVEVETLVLASFFPSLLSFPFCPCFSLYLSPSLFSLPLPLPLSFLSLPSPFLLSSSLLFLLPSPFSFLLSPFSFPPSPPSLPPPFTHLLFYSLATDHGRTCGTVEKPRRRESHCKLTVYVSAPKDYAFVCAYIGCAFGTSKGIFPITLQGAIVN